MKLIRSSVCLLIFTAHTVVTVDEWNLVFKMNTAGRGSFYDLYIGNNTSNLTKQETLNNFVGEHFKSDIINYWTLFPIERVKVSVEKGGQETTYLVFNGTASNKHSWFSHKNLLETSFTDLMNANERDFNYFKLDGHIHDSSGGVDRRFYINNIYAGCLKDYGWMMVLDIHRTGVCLYELMYPKPVILVCPGKTKCNYQDEASNLVADSLSVFVSFDSKLYLTSKPSDMTTTASLTASTSPIIDIKESIQKVKDEITVDPKLTNSFKRKKISIPDGRMSAMSIGMVGVCVLCLVFDSLVLSDVISLLKWIIGNNQKQ